MGTDCSGGYSSSIINSMRLSVLASNSIKLSKELGLGEGAGEGEGAGSEYIPLDYTDSVYLATLGGAQLLDMEENLGSLEPGKLADFLLVDMQGTIFIIQLFVCYFKKIKVLYLYHEIEKSLY